MYCICAHNGDMREEDLNRELEKGYADMVAGNARDVLAAFDNIRQSRNRDIDSQLKQMK